MKQYSLSELCQLISGVIGEGLASSYWVRAEIASVMSKSGHGYFELIEKAPEANLPTAKLRATCWASIYPMLSAYFEQETGCRLQVGMQVLLEVEVHFHAAYGLSLNIINIDPRFTMGDLAQQRAETLRRLTEEGVIELQHGLVLPTLTRRLAVISAASAAGYGDFEHQLQSSGYRFETQLFAATMQGEGAERSILQALQNILGQVEEFDAVVIIRGGGASTDLSCFDSYLLAAACAQFELPILTGIGHTRDVSIVDIVAHQALKTPTAVAAFLIERLSREAERIERLRRRLGETAKRQVLIRQHRLEMLQQRIESCNPERIYARGYSLSTDEQGRVIKSVKDVKRGERIVMHLRDGEVKGKIED